MSNKQKFFSQLQGLYVGAELHGKGGMAKLLQFKCEYFRKISPLIESEIEKQFLDVKDKALTELYDKLYTFFSSYLTEGGSIYFSNTPVYKNVYAKVYFDKEDTALFYKTKDLYYVKSQIMYETVENLTFKYENKNVDVYFDFDANHYKPTNNNTKEHVLFLFTGIQKSKIQFKVIEKSQIISDIKNEIIDKQLEGIASKYTINIDNNALLSDSFGFDAINYQQNKDNQTATIKFLKENNITTTSDVIDKAIEIYKKQTEVDFFIHKNAKGFLTEQFNLFMYNYLSNDMDSLLQQDRLDNIKKIKKVAFCVIEYIAKFEDELKAIWNKPKFVRNSNYVITMDKLIANEFDMSILTKHVGMSKQIQEWQDLGIVDSTFKFEQFFLVHSTDSANAKYKYLPFDTKHFDTETKYALLSLFDNFDEQCDGVLIKSENWQALNTIIPKYKEQIDLIYIDPPFNLDHNADYLYNVNYKDSTWATILENRLHIAHKYLNDFGCIGVRCDYNGNFLVRQILNSVFEKNNFINEVSVGRIFKNKTDKTIKQLPFIWDTLCIFSKSAAFEFVNPYKMLDNTRQGYWRHMNDSEGQGSSKIFFGMEIEPPKGKHWKYKQETINEKINSKLLRIDCMSCTYIHSTGDINNCPQCGGIKFNPKYYVFETNYKIIDSNWTDIAGYSSITPFNTENAEALLQRFINTTTQQNSLVIDFFAGSATTQAVAHKLGRKWIGVEMGEQFYSIDIPRLKKVLFGEQKGISKDLKPKFHGGGIFKYYELEQYEDVLDRAVYNSTNDNAANLSYNFSDNEKLAHDGLTIDEEDTSKPITYSFEKLYSDVDIWETISNLSGYKIKKFINPDEVTYMDKNGTEIKILKSDLTFDTYPLLKHLIWW